MAEKTAAWENPATTVIAEFMTGFPPKPPAQKAGICPVSGNGMSF